MRIDTMNKEAIIAAAGEMQTTHDLLNLLNNIKMSELEDKGYPFIMPHLNYFIHPTRNKNSYKTFSIPKKSGGERTISAPTRLLKSFLTFTNKLLQAFYEAPDYVNGFVPEKSVVDNAERHIGMNYVFNTDLKDFFPSITKSRVWATLKHPPFNFNDTIADAIAGLCCTEMEANGEKSWVLPQGSPCSPILTNIVCNTLDHKLHKLAKKFNLRYSRYADDITFSGNRNVFQKDGKFIKEFNQIITKQHFSVNEKKTRVQNKNQRQEVTGLVVSDRVNVTREYVRSLDNLLYIWERYGEADAYTKFIVHYIPKQNLYKRRPNMRCVIQGKLQYLKMVKGSDNEVWRRLQRRYNKLSGVASSTESAVIKYRYTISDFEKKIGQKLQFDINDRAVLRCFFSINGQHTEVSLSRYSRTRFSNVIVQKDYAKLDQLKSSFMLLYYEQRETGFWRIERKRKWVKLPIMDELNANTMLETISAVLVDASDKTNTLTCKDSNTDEVLTSLINSNFDLKKLDEWDKIKSN